MAEVRSLQSQLHSVNRRGASGDLIILPLSSMSEVLGIKTVLLSGKCSVEKELRTQASRTPISAIWNSVRARCRIFLQGNEFVKLVICLEEIQLWRRVCISWCTSGASTNCCGEYLAIAITSVNGRRASGDLIILPLSSITEDLGIKTVLLSAKCAGIVPPSSTCLYAQTKSANPTLPHICKNCTELHQGQEQIPYMRP